jgi:hypothetical protein
MAEPVPPGLRHIAALRSLTEYPSANKEWSLERKLEAIKEAGFDGFTALLTPEHERCARKFDLMPIGYFSSGTRGEFKPLLEQNRAAGARHIHVQLGDHDTSTKEALKLLKRLLSLAERIDVKLAVEVQRDTCTETPEKTFALADAFQKATGQLLPFAWDFSHFAVMKQLSPPYWNRLGARPDLIQRSQQFHFRPFNGHHCQVPVTGKSGQLTPEANDFLSFVEKLFECWLEVASPGHEIFAVAEMGPLRGGFNLHGLPNSWEEAVVLASEIGECWRRAIRRWKPPASSASAGVA